MVTAGGRFLCRLVGFKASAHQPDIKLSHFKASCTCLTRCVQLEYSVCGTHINSLVGIDGGEDAETQLRPALLHLLNVFRKNLPGPFVLWLCGNTPGVH